MIIGMMGYMGAGKDTVADILVEEQGFTKLSFADSLKDVVSSVFGWDRDLVEGSTPESREFRDEVDEWWSSELGIEDFTPRKALQLIGTDLFREKFNGDIWVKNTIRRATLYENVIIADIRFVNEANLVLENQGTLVRITKGMYPIWHDVAQRAMSGDTSSLEYMKTHYAGVHRSEWDCINVNSHYHLRNDGTIEELKAQVLDMHSALRADD